MVSDLTERLADKLQSLPASPGVYLMKDRGGVIFYIGKAKSLRDRVRGYFSGSDTRAFVALLESLLHDLEVILTNSEKEALILENDLVKKHQPRFNVVLKDDKRYICLRIDGKKEYPRVEVVRRFAKDGARYFGPYTSAQSVRQTLRIINRYFQLRTCSDQVLNNRSRPCLQYQIKRCPAPCVFALNDGRYGQNVENVINFLAGDHAALVARLRGQMQEQSAALNFESAAHLRDQIQAVERSLEHQRVVSSDFVNRDVVGFYRQGPHIEMHVLRTRDGRLIEAQRYSLPDTEIPSNEVLADFAGRYYENNEEIPDEIVFPTEMEWGEALAQSIKDRVGRRVDVYTPSKGEKRRLVELANNNAKQAFLDKQREEGAAQSALEKLRKSLHLRNQPKTMECFDISHHQGSHIVASLVRFENGAADKSGYRRYKIKTTSGQDDFQSMYEVVSRRVRRGIEDGDLPDLIIIDGGKGQLSSAKAALADHGVDAVDLIGLAKSRLKSEDSAATNSALRSPERVFLVDRKNPVILRQNSAELFLLTRARDEAHRFAITFHRQLRRKAVVRSLLSDIPGVGPQKRRLLLKTFGSVARLKAAPIDAIAGVVGLKLAREIVARFAAPTDKKNI